MAIALRIAANNFRELSDTNSPTKLCDFADSVRYALPRRLLANSPHRYYICTIKIAMELTGEEREQVGVVDLRSQVELLLYPPSLFTHNTAS